MLRLSELKKGDRARVVGFDEPSTSYARHLLSLGLIPGTRIKVARFAPLGDPIEIQFRGALSDPAPPRSERPAPRKAMTTIALIGNPNAGKTTVFNGLTGAHQRVGNWPGVTVERKSGHFRHGDERLEVVDLPGIYSLLSVNATDAQDSRIARDFLLDGDIDVIVNVVDAVEPRARPVSDE